MVSIWAKNQSSQQAEMWSINRQFRILATLFWRHCGWCAGDRWLVALLGLIHIWGWGGVPPLAAVHLCIPAVATMICSFERIYTPCMPANRDPFKGMGLLVQVPRGKSGIEKTIHCLQNALWGAIQKGWLLTVYCTCEEVFMVIQWLLWQWSGTLTGLVVIADNVTAVAVIKDTITSVAVIRDTN